MPGPRCPILVVTAAEDRLVPKSATRPNRLDTFVEVPNVGYLRVIFDQGTADSNLERADADARETVWRLGNGVRHGWLHLFSAGVPELMPGARSGS
jgi:hypothetical protein